MQEIVMNIMKNYLLILLTLMMFINVNGQDTKWPIFPLEVQKYLLYPNEDVCSIKKQPTKY